MPTITATAHAKLDESPRALLADELDQVAGGSGRHYTLTFGPGKIIHPPLAPQGLFGNLLG